MRISEADRSELAAISRSETMRSDMAQLSLGRHNPFGEGDEISADRVVEFLTQYNELLNHPIKPLRRFEEGNMKL